MKLNIDSFYESPRWSAEAIYCPNPLTFDQYSNCSHKCAFCFAQYQRMLIRGDGRKAYMENRAKAVNVEKVKAIFSGKKTQYSKYIEMKKVLQWGGMSDPFCYFEKQNGVGLELMRFFREIDYPIVFATKGTWWLDDSRYTELLKDNKNWDVRISIITLNKDKALKVERGVSTPIKRLQAIEKLSKLNIGNIILRLRPFIFGISDIDYLQLIKEGYNYGAKSCSIGFFCYDYRMTPKNLKIINDNSGFDQRELYKKFSANSGCPLRLNRNIKREYVYNAESLCNELGMKFSVGDRHFKERSQWKYKIDNKNVFNKHSSGQFAYAAIVCKKNGFVKWEDISWDMEHFKGVKYALNNEPCERRSYFFDFTMEDYFKYLWNNPSESQSPYRMFEGIMIPDSKDNNGNLVYKYNKEKE